jgi:hypothetical protein
MHAYRLTQRGLNDLKRTKLSCFRIIRLHALPPPPLPLANCLFLSVFVYVGGPAFLTGERGGGGGRGAESYYRKKTWASINRSILSGLTRQLFFDEREGCRGGGGEGGHDSNSNFSEDKCQKIYIACPGYCPLYSRL